MFKIENNVIYCTRGDKGNIPIKIPINEDKTEFYKFQIGDIVTFAVYNKKGYDAEPLIYKKITIEEVSELCNIPLASDETKIGDYIVKNKEYWYEVTLNDSETILGHNDNDEAQIFWLMPEGREKNVE